MERKEYGLDPKSNQTERKESKVNTGKLNGTLADYYSRMRDNATQRIIETYRAVIRGVDRTISFDDTIQAMVGLGYYACSKTKAELEVLYNDQIGHSAGRGGVYEN